MGKIRCVILRRDRSIKILNVNPSTEYFRFSNGIYNVDNEAVNMTNPSPNIPELIYVEGNPRPIGSTEDAIKIFDKQLFKKLIEDTVEPKGFAFDIIADYLKDPSKVIVWIFIVIIIYGVLQSFLGGLA